MDFRINSTTQKKLDIIEEFLLLKIYPLEPLFLQHQWDEVFQHLNDLRKEVKTLGLWAPNLPKQLGGNFESLLDLALIGEVLGRSPLGHYVFGCHAPDAGNAELLHLFGSESQKKQYLQPLAEGKIRSCFAMTEPHTAGSNPTLLESQAELVNDEWVLNGRKWFTTAAEGSDFAIAMMVTDPDAQKHLRASMIIVPTDTPGYTRVRNISVMGNEGKDYFSHAEVVFDNCKVPKSNLLGERGKGFALAQERLGPGRIQHCMRWLGIARRVLDVSRDFMVQRKINSAQTLAQQPLMQAQIAQSLADLESARLLVLKTAWTIDQNGFKASKNLISLIKFNTAHVVNQIMDRSLQSLGALGMTDDTIVSFFFREERAARIYDGADEVHKLVAARQFLRC